MSMGCLFLATTRFITLVSFTLFQINPVFALEKKESISFDLTTETINNTYARSNTIAELILKSGFSPEAEKFLLKKALSEGVFDKKPIKMKLVKKDIRTIFKFDNDMSIEVKKDDRTVWINGTLLDLEKIKDIRSLHDEVFRIVSKKKYSLIDLLLPRASAQGLAIYYIVMGSIAVVGAIVIILDDVRNGKTLTRVRKTFFMRDFAIEHLDVRNVKCEKFPSKEKSKAGSASELPSEVDVAIYQRVGYGDKTRVKFKITYDDQQKLAEIVDGKGCVHKVLRNGYFARIENIEYDVNNLTDKCDFPMGSLGDAYNNQGGYVKRNDDDFTAKKYANEMFAYDHIVKECKKDSAKDFNFAVEKYKKGEDELKARQEEYKAKILREKQEEEARVADGKKPRSVAEPQPSAK